MDPDFKSAQQGNLQETPKPVDQNFSTPATVAARDDLASQVVLPESSFPPPVDKTGWRQKLKQLKISWPPTKKQGIILSSCSVLMGGIIIALILNHTGPKPVVHAIKLKAIPKVTTVPSTLSGLPVDPSVNQRPVTGVMIENTLDARPQSGLGDAKVVFEAVAEGGVTRFLALFQDTAPANLGPVRSARPYYIQWAMGFNASYAHVGGSPDGLADIKAWGTRDLDEFANAGAYHRITTRIAPHNMYTSIASLNQLEASKNFTGGGFSGFVRKAAAPSKVPTAKSINMSMSGPIYNPHYDYVAATNSYNRSEGGAPHIDANTNAQISPQVVIAMVVPESSGALDSSGAYYSNYAAIGTGAVYVFQDGTVTTGQWSKSSQGAQVTFTTANGQPLALNPGQTWITAISSASAVTYTP